MSARLLIVDDTPDTVEMLTDWLQSLGYETLGANSGHAALAVAAQYQPDLILLDVTMPGMDGLETCRQLRANPATHGVPVILVTAKSPTDARAEGMLAGAVDYITKPIDFDHLHSRIQSILKTEGAYQANTARLFAELVHSAVVLLPCNLAWLLVVDSGTSTLESLAIATGPDESAAARFIDALGSADRQIHFDLVAHGSPLADILVTRQMAFDLPLRYFEKQPGAGAFYEAGRATGLHYVSLLPLAAGSRMAGLLVIGTAAPSNFDSASGKQMITALASQASITVDYTQLARSLSEQEEIMQAEQVFLNMVLDTMGDGLVVVGEDGRIEFVNSRLALMSGYSRQELNDQDVSLLFHPEDRAEIRTNLLSEQRSTMKFEQRLYTRHQSVLPVLLARSSFAVIEPGASQQVIVLSDLTEQKQREDALERRGRQLNALNLAAQAITSALSLHEVITEILKAAVEVVHCDGASIMLSSKETVEELVFVAAVGPEADRMVGLRVPYGQGIAGWVALEARSQLVADTRNDERFYGSIDNTTGLTTQSLAAVPLIFANEVIGVLEVVNKRTGPFDSIDVELLESMAGTAAVAIENARLFDETRRRLRELGTLLDASAAVSSTLDFGSVLEVIARRLVEALSVERGLIAAWDNQADILFPLAEVVDAYWPPNTGPDLNLDNFPQHRAALKSGVPIFARANDRLSTPADQAALRAEGQEALLGFPLWINRSVVGIILLYSSMPGHAFSDANTMEVDQVVQRWLEGLDPEQDWRERDPLTRLCNSLTNVAGATWIAIEEWNKTHNRTYRLRESGFTLWTEASSFQYDLSRHTTMKRVLTTGNPKVVGRSDLDNDPEERTILERAGGHVGLITPLMIHGTPQGIVKLIDIEASRHFDDEEISLAQGIANVVGNALENAQLYRSLERRAKALEEAYADLRQADQLKNDLLQNLSHELQTPLLHILGYTELMRDEAFGPLTDEQRENLDFVIRRVQHVSELVADIVTVQSLANEKLEITATDLTEIIGQALHTWTEVASRRSITLELQCPTNLSLVSADKKRIGQVIDHLLDNAIKFSPDSSRVAIHVVDEENKVRVQVRDQGEGIPAELQDRIFERFYQADGSATRHHAGTGLGLSIVKEIVTRHNGVITVESEMGRGSTFAFTLEKSAPAAAGLGIRLTATSDILPNVNR